jgi:CRISPR-associated protein Cas1
MARGWRVVDATSLVGVVSGSRGRITFTPDGGATTEVPAEELAVVLIGIKTTVTSAALHYLTKHDIAFLGADWRGVPFAGLFSWGDHTRVAARHIAQANVSLPRAKNAWMQIVRAKIRGQAANLRLTDAGGAGVLDRYAKDVKSGDPNNAEGAAARHYWQRLFSGHERFTRDQDGGDPVNAMLNYGYMVLRGHGIRAVLGAGLAPPLGVFHRGRSNYFNLVDDLIEPFRPAIDSVVVNLGVDANLDSPEVKHQLVEAAAQPFSPEGYRVPAVLDDLAQQLGRYFEGDVDRLTVQAWSGPVAESQESSDGNE